MGEARKRKMIQAETGKMPEPAVEPCEFCGKFTTNKGIEVDMPGGEVKVHIFCTECENKITADMERYEEEAKKPKIMVPKKKVIIHRN